MSLASSLWPVSEESYRYCSLRTEPVSWPPLFCQEHFCYHTKCLWPSGQVYQNSLFFTASQMWMPQQSGLEAAGHQRPLKDGRSLGKQEVNLLVKWPVLQRSGSVGRSPVHPALPPQTGHHEIDWEGHRKINPQYVIQTYWNVWGHIVIGHFTELQPRTTADSSALCNHSIGIHRNLLARAYFEFLKHG